MKYPVSLPDFDSPISIPHNTEYIIPENGWIFRYARTTTSWSEFYIKNQLLSGIYTDGTNHYTAEDSIFLPVEKNTSIKSIGCSPIEYIFYPSKR